MTEERLELKQAEPISDADKLAEAEAWIHCIPVEIRWMFEEALSVGNRLRAEVEQLRAWVGDLQSGMYVNCVYCGHRYGPGETTPVSMADALKAHVEECPHHPMSALRRENERLKAKLSERGIE